MNYAIINIEGDTFIYTPIAPRTDVAAESEGARLMFKHDRNNSLLFIAPAGVITSGWVLGTNATNEGDRGATQAQRPGWARATTETRA